MICKRGPVVALVVVTLVAVLPVPAAADAVEVGPKIGGVVTWLSGADWTDTLDLFGGINGTSGGLIGGAYLAINVVGGLGLQFEALYTRLGGAYSYDAYLDTMLITVDGTVATNAFEFPLLLRGRAAVGNGFLYAAVGPSFIVLPDAITFTEEGAGIEVSNDMTPDNELVSGGAAEAGVLISAGAGYVDVGIRYARSFTAIFNDVYGDEIFVNGVGFTLGYAARL